MNNYYKNQMHPNLAGINSPVDFACDAAISVAHLAQAVFVNLNNFKHKSR